MLGEFVVVCLCDIWELPQFSLFATICTMLCLYINFKQNYLFTFHKILTFMLGFPNIHLGSSLLQKVVVSATDPIREFDLVSKFKQSLFFIYFKLQVSVV